MKKPFEPNFRTSPDKFCKEEINKLNSNGLRGHLKEDFLDHATPDLAWESEALAKSHGMYLEFNRAKTGEEKDWIYMIRIGVPGGGPITGKQWAIMDELAEKYGKDPEGNASIRLTNRQNVQFHWIRKPHVLELIKAIAESGLMSLNGCGDNTRNVMGCPLSAFSDIYDGNAWAWKVARYFQLPLDPFIEVWGIDPKYIRRPEESFQYAPNLLNRKFKIGFSAVHKNPETGKIVADNCVELRTNDLSIAPIVENGKVSKFQIYIGGGQGERNGKPSLSALGLPLCKVPEAQLLQVLDAILKVHMEWGDRENRWWARLKILVKKKGTSWYRDQVSAKLGFPLERPDENHDYGPRHLHLGWIKQPKNGLWAYGAFIENGRLSDVGQNGRLKSMVRDIMKKYPIDLMITPNQDILFTNITDEIKKTFESELQKYGFGLRNKKPYSRLRLNSGACVGRDTCRLTYTDSEKFEPYLVDDLEAMGWGDISESIGITGCERQCFRPATKTIGLVGTGLNRYQLRLGGTEDARHQGRPLISSDGESMYLRSIPRERVSAVIDTIFKRYKAEAKNGESLGLYYIRTGPDAMIEHLKTNPVTQDLMSTVSPTDCVIE